jgi:hypothetical protein
MNVDDLNEVKGLVDWLTPARAAYISAVISQPIDPRKAFLRLPELWPKEPHQVFGLRAHPVGWRIGLSGYALAWRRPPESVIDPVGTTVVEVGEFDPLDYSDENQVLLEYLRPWLLGFSSAARTHQRDVALDAIRVQPAMMYGAEITLDQFNRTQYLLIYAEDKVEEASAQIRHKIMRGEAWDLPRDTWQPADLQRALQLVADGIPSRDASEATGVPVGAILVRMRGGRRGLSSIERQDAVVEALKLGFTQDEIVQLLDENPLYVANVAARPQRSATVLAVRAALADVARGMTPHAAALKHNVSYFVVLHRLRTASSGQAKGAPRAPGGGGVA